MATTVARDESAESASEVVVVNSTTARLPAPFGGARRREQDAEFTAFAATAGGELAKTAWLLAGDPHRASELVQATLVRTYLAWPRARTADPLAYARRTLINLNIDTWRRRRREVLVAPATLNCVAEPAEPAALVETRDQLARALAGLTAHQRRVVVLRYFSGMSEREIADDLGVSEGTVKAHAHRGLNKLRSDLGASWPTSREGNTR